jgi:hypothetical protein
LRPSRDAPWRICCEWCRGAAGGRGGASGSKPGVGGKPAVEVMGPGAKMLEEMRKKGKPVDPKMEQMANWLDGLAKDGGATDMGEVPPSLNSAWSPYSAIKK